MATASKVDGLYRLNVSTMISASGLLAAKGDSAMLWHRDIEHIGFDRKRQLDGALSIKMTDGDGSPREICVLGKHARLRFSENEEVVRFGIG